MEEDNSFSPWSFFVFLALSTVVLARIITYPKIFRDGLIAFTGNDPYHYRVLVGRYANHLDILDINSFFGVQIKNGEPLMVAVLGFFSKVLGGTQETVSQVMAWYPVVAGVLVACFVYLAASRIFSRRVGVLSVLSLSLMYSFVFRTSLGYADHHAFDYIWLSLTFLSVIGLTQAEISKVPWLWIFAFAAGVSGQVLSWEFGPAFLFPLCVFFAAEAVKANSHDVNYLKYFSPYILGLGLASVLILMPHLFFGWHQDFVAAFPLLLLAGLFFLCLLGEVSDRLSVSTRGFALLETISGVAGFLAIYLFFPLASKVGKLFRSNEASIREVEPLFANLGNPMDTFGFFWIVGIVYLVLVTWLSYKRESSELSALSVYTWITLFYAAIQIRFSGELSVFFAVLSGLGVAHIASLTGKVRSPLPTVTDKVESLLPTVTDKVESLSPTLTNVEFPALLGNSERSKEILLPGRSLAIYLSVFLVVASFSLLHLPSLHKASGISDTEYENVRAMQNYSEKHSLRYPDNYVLSTNNRNRMYNYFVNGYRTDYSRSRIEYRALMEATTPQNLEGEETNGVCVWKEGLRCNGFSRRCLQGKGFTGIGFVVTDPLSPGPDELPKEYRKSLYYKLHVEKGGSFELYNRNGSVSERFGGLGSYRLVYNPSTTGSKAFALVSGFNLRGEAQPDSTVEIDKKVDGVGIPFRYSRVTEADSDGRYSVRVAYPGVYRVNGEEKSPT